MQDTENKKEITEILEFSAIVDNMKMNKNIYMKMNKKDLFLGLNNSLFNSSQYIFLSK